MWRVHGRCYCWIVARSVQDGRGGHMDAGKISESRCLHRCTDAREIRRSPKKSHGPGCFLERSLTPHVFGKSPDRVEVLCNMEISMPVRLPIGSLTTGLVMMFTGGKGNQMPISKS